MCVCSKNENPRYKSCDPEWANEPIYPNMDKKRTPVDTICNDSKGRIREGTYYTVLANAFVMAGVKCGSYVKCNPKTVINLVLDCMGERNCLKRETGMIEFKAGQNEIEKTLREAFIEGWEVIGLVQDKINPESISAFNIIKADNKAVLGIDFNGNDTTHEISSLVGLMGVKKFDS